jgi:hypothetical protein
MIRLLRAELHLMEGALAGDDALARALGHDVVAGWATFTEALQPTRDALAANPDASAWGARFFVAGDPPELVGWGGFKGPPKDGVAELGYEIAEGRRAAWSRHRGDAGDARGGVHRRAGHDGDRPHAGRAQCLDPRPRETGLRYEGEAEEDGEVVWRFSLTRRASGG